MLDRQGTPIPSKKTKSISKQSNVNQTPIVRKQMIEEFKLMRQ
jgi:hypothetical protein